MVPKQKKANIFRWIHLEAALVFVAYFVVSNLVLVSSATSTNINSFIFPLIFGIISSFVFIYLFSHKDFFHFITKFEDEEKKKEKKYLHRFKQFGKTLTCIIVSLLGGPIFLALTVRFLYSKSSKRYWIALLSTTISTIVMVMVVKGVLFLY